MIPPLIPPLRHRIERALSQPLAASRPLSGGSLAEARWIRTQDGSEFAVKQMPPRDDQPGGLPPASLKDEAFMLTRLRQAGCVPVPDVIHVEPDLLILSYIPNDPREAHSQAALADLAEKLAALHSIQVPRFGFDRPTPIGPLQRPNPWAADWPSFFRDHRLLYLGRLAQAAGRLPEGGFARLERFCARIEDWIPKTEAASLIHGDLWIGNILFQGGKLAGLIDPATYFADPEIELAFLTLFGGIGQNFFARYQEIRPIDPLFFSERRALYHVEPLLAHAYFFGGSYGARADGILKRLIG